MYEHDPSCVRYKSTKLVSSVLRSSQRSIFLLPPIKVSRTFTGDNQFKLKTLLNKNEGFIANNILHKREAFSDSNEERLLYRIRFKNRIFNNASN